jgi:hypothetical protein
VPLNGLTEVAVSREQDRSIEPNGTRRADERHDRVIAWGGGDGGSRKLAASGARSSAVEGILQHVRLLPNML